MANKERTDSLTNDFVTACANKRYAPTSLGDATQLGTDCARYELTRTIGNVLTLKPQNAYQAGCRAAFIYATEAY
jgi:hypothetical protein